MTQTPIASSPTPAHAAPRSRRVDMPSARPGVHRIASGRTVARVFAPLARQVSVLFGEPAQRMPLARDEFGFWHGNGPPQAAGTCYWIDVDGERFSDPASRRQPQGVHGPSMMVDIVPARSPGWPGMAIEDAVICELHVGTFTPEGTLAAAREKLPHLQSVGFNAVELMPLAAFPGERNWGYDGTHLFALHDAYGDHDDLRRFIEAAHEAGIAVLLDVVHNHFGPEGHYADRLAPYTKPSPTPWGAAVNVDGAWNHGVREFLLDNIRHWIGDVGFDGLRMDATAWIVDNMPVHILREAAALAHAIGAAQGRQVIMIAEDLRNNHTVTHADGHGFDGQWNDDLGHALFAVLTGERGGHLRDFGRFDDVTTALQDGFVFDGSRFSHRFLHPAGTDGRGMHGREHVVYVQNHDQVGNRPHGDRMIATHGRERTLLALTAVMASPFVPMLFMGDEYGETAPFHFFEDFGDPHLVEAVKIGRRADHDFGDAEPADPHARETFEASKLDWRRADSPAGQAVLAVVRTLIALKRSGALGPRQRELVHIGADAASQVIVIDAPRTRTVLNLSARSCDLSPWWPDRAALALATQPLEAAGRLPAFGAVVLVRDADPAG